MATDHIPLVRARRIWIEDGEVLIETKDGQTFSLSPEVAIEFGRLLSTLGAEALIARSKAEE